MNDLTTSSYISESGTFFTIPLNAPLRKAQSSIFLVKQYSFNLSSDAPRKKA